MIARPCRTILNPSLDLSGEGGYSHACVCIPPPPSALLTGGPFHIERVPYCRSLLLYRAREVPPQFEWCFECAFSTFTKRRYVEFIAAWGNVWNSTPVYTLKIQYTFGGDPWCRGTDKRTECITYRHDLNRDHAGWGMVCEKEPVRCLGWSISDTKVPL